MGKYKVMVIANSLNDILTVHSLVKDLQEGKEVLLKDGYCLEKDINIGLNIEKATW